jgi:hypothetical protein
MGNEPILRVQTAMSIILEMAPELVLAPCADSNPGPAEKLTAGRQVLRNGMLRSMWH